jgi:hypothetical protein
MNSARVSRVLAKLSVLFAVQNQLESTLDKFIAAKVTLGSELDFQSKGSSLLNLAATLGFGWMVTKLLEIYAEEMVYKPTMRYSHLTRKSEPWESRVGFGVDLT